MEFEVVFDIYFLLETHSRQMEPGLYCYSKSFDIPLISYSSYQMFIQYELVCPPNHQMKNSPPLSRQNQLKIIYSFASSHSLSSDKSTSI